MLRRATFVTCCLTLVACGGGDGGTNPPPPEVNRVASVAAVDTSILQFTGKKVALSKLFVAKDANGVALPTARLSCVTPSGFTLTGDSLVAPTVEARGKLRCSATTLQPSAMQLAPALAAGSDPVDSLTVTAGIDLRAYTWRAAWKCTGGRVYYDALGGGTADSVAFDGRVASVLYSGDAGYYPQGGDLSQFTLRVARTYYKGGTVAASDSLTYPAGFVWVYRQAPDTLFMQNGGRNYATMQLVRDPLTVTHRYTGGDWCSATQAAIGPVTLEEVTP